TPFLEVHHLIRLKDGGPDTVENCAALCPNCHRKLHYSSEKTSLTEYLRDFFK
ncbi:HNH endonuclease signature motif containing protein, partial [Halomonas marinisediminis]